MTDTPPKLLVVDDDPAIRKLIHRFLSKQQYQMESAPDGKTALALFEKFQPDLVILDVNLPDATGYELCREMQAKTGVYVLMLTSRSDEADKIKGFRQGADDYLTKPFSLMELGVRVSAILKRGRGNSPRDLPQPSLNFGSLVIDPERHEVTLDDQLITLTALEFNILHFLANHPGRVWNRQELLQRVWDYDYVGDQRVVDVHIGQIRKKMESAGAKTQIIQTVRGVGYRFNPPDAAPPAQ
ncbi:response regulator transcription factor [Limnothrix sp. FACHB-881]|uniref:response regulator transcription factor n=1 Tax=unclassified Limnothrix TaxID=2632864 RepID=UPI00081E3F78|nr:MULTISPECIES: response regulator transcription factor [unclassified Limnothrix]MBD2635182.1 response regulator transcription factor [Limnothrix sp. FACHB-881]OCQ90917.1 DNA-binding response regulator [Limnothrix sp. P13C2]PIB12790.1 transcriptional regulator [Limnothrix sp. PR1529]